MLKSQEENWYLNSDMFGELTTEIYNQAQGLSEIQAKPYWNCVCRD